MNTPKTLTELFSDASRWTQRTDARNAQGEELWFNDDEAVCWCLMSGLNLVYRDNLGIFKQVYFAMREKVGSLIAYNDAPDRTFSDIQNLVQKVETELVV